MWNVVIGAVVGGVATGVTSYLTNKKKLDAYNKAIDATKEAAEKYSGENAYNQIKAAGDAEARNNMLREGAYETMRGNMNQNLSDAYLEGMNLGQQNKQQELDSKYYKDTNAANRLMKQGDIESKAFNQMAQSGLNTAGGLADIMGKIGRQPKDEDDGTSDERLKEYNNHSDLPKANVEDALRQIESVAYKYKDGTGLDQDDHIGVTAQSLEGTAFDDVVKEDEGGIKKLDKWKLQESVMAGIAALQKEIDALEGKE